MILNGNNEGKKGKGVVIERKKFDEKRRNVKKEI